MTSEKKAASNRSNAAHSTGPKSKAGKERSSANAFKHGAYATRHLVFGEDQKLYNAIRDEQRERFKPQTYIEKALIAELVNQLWNLRRLEKSELYFLSEIQTQLLHQFPPKVTSAELDMINRVNSGEQATLSKGSRAKMQRISKEAGKIEKLYERAFIYDEGERMHRISAQKRSSLQTILNIERELEARLRRRVEALTVD